MKERVKTWTSLEVPGSTMPEVGRAQYFSADVVWNLNAMRSLPWFARLSVTVSDPGTSKVTSAGLIRNSFAITLALRQALCLGAVFDTFLT